MIYRSEKQARKHGWGGYARDDEGKYVRTGSGGYVTLPPIVYKVSLNWELLDES